MTASTNAIRLDPAVDAAKRTIAALPALQLPKDANEDIITMVVVILRLAGYQVADHTGEGHPNTTPAPKVTP